MNSIGLSQLLSIIPVMLLIEALFAGSEIALLSADKIQLKTLARKGSAGAKMALQLASHPERVLSTTLLITSVCMIGISCIVTLFMTSRHPQHGDLLAVATTSPLIVLFGELVPKMIFQRNATRIAPWVARIVLTTHRIFFPLTRLLALYTSSISRLAAPVEELLTGKHRTTRDEIRALLSFGKRETEIKSSEKTMIKRIFDFRDAEAKHALIPLVKVDAIEESLTTREALELFVRHRHSRMPVYAERVDNVVGVLYSQDLLTLPPGGSSSIRPMIRPAYYVPETQALEDLLQEMRRESREMAVVVDEYGGAVGILTFEDIVEEIVGEISDEYDTELAPFKELGPEAWLVQARMEVARINDQLRLELPDGDYETLGGFLLQQFGRIPETGDELYFDTPRGSLKFSIRKASERHIETVRIDVVSESASPPSAASES